MKKLLFILISIFAVVTALIFPQPVQALTAGSSAALITPEASKQQVQDNRARILKRFLESYDAPLTPYAQTFISEADKNHIDWKLVAAISGVESYFGQQIPAYSYNGWGYGVYGTNVRRFASWEDGIAVVSKAIRDDYMDTWGATNVAEIGSKYAADPRWTYKVQHFIDLISEFETKENNKALSISL